MKERFKKGRFGMFNQGESMETNPFVELASTKYGGEVFRLFLFYMGVVEYDNKIKRLTQQEISEIIGIAYPNVSKANKILQENGIVYKVGRDLYINEKFLIKGLRNHKRA